MFVIEVIIFTWRILTPEILDSIHVGSVIYFLLVLSLIPMIMVVGWY